MNVNGCEDYKVISGTSYYSDTKDNIIAILEDLRKTQVRITLDYGNIETGESWDEVYGITGRIGRSCGRIKRPLLIYRSSSIGGGAILDNCIIGIKESRGGKILYGKGLDL